MKSDRNADRHNSSQGIQDGKRGVCVPERNPLARVDQKKKKKKKMLFLKKEGGLKKKQTAAACVETLLC